MAEDNLKFHLFDESRTMDKKDKKRIMMDDDTFGDDEFYDRTLAKKSNKGNKAKAEIGEAENFDSLKTKLEDLLAKRKDIS